MKKRIMALLLLVCLVLSGLSNTKTACADGDWYTYDPEKDRTVGRRNRRIFVRGQELRVRLERVDLDRYELDLTMVMPEGTPAAAPEKPKKMRFGRRESRNR